MIFWISPSLLIHLIASTPLREPGAAGKTHSLLFQPLIPLWIVGLSDGGERLFSLALRKKSCAEDLCRESWQKFVAHAETRGFHCQATVPFSEKEKSITILLSWLPPSCIDLSLQQPPEKCSFHCLK